MSDAIENEYKIYTNSDIIDGRILEVGLGDKGYIARNVRDRSQVDYHRTYERSASTIVRFNNAYGAPPVKHDIINADFLSPAVTPPGRLFNVAIVDVIESETGLAYASARLIITKAASWLLAGGIIIQEFQWRSDNTRALRDWLNTTYGPMLKTTLPGNRKVFNREIGYWQP